MQVTAERDLCGEEIQCRFDNKRLLPIDLQWCRWARPSLATSSSIIAALHPAFAGYNRARAGEGMGRALRRPAHPAVDPIDWVERIPFSETRNYVQRVLENVQVYRVRFGGGSKLMIEADLHRGAVN